MNAQLQILCAYWGRVMNIFKKFIEGIRAAFKGMLSVAAIGILALFLPLIMLKMKGSEGKEIVRRQPELKVKEASLIVIEKRTPIEREIVVLPQIESPSSDSFSFGTSMDSGSQPVLDRSQDPNF